LLGGATSAWSCARLADTNKMPAQKMTAPGWK
jgi:hypothetical protein